MNPIEQYITNETRRQFFGRSAKGLGLAALASLFPMARNGSAAERADQPGSEPASFCPACQTSHLFVHVRGALPDGHV